MQIQKTDNKASFGIRTIRFANDITPLGEKTVNAVREAMDSEELFLIGDNLTDIFVGNEKGKLGAMSFPLAPSKRAGWAEGLADTKEKVISLIKASVANMK